jgi:hypothetical protein
VLILDERFDLKVFALDTHKVGPNLAELFLSALRIRARLNPSLKGKVDAGTQRLEVTDLDEVPDEFGEPAEGLLVGAGHGNGDALVGTSKDSGRVVRVQFDSGGGSREDLARHRALDLSEVDWVASINGVVSGRLGESYKPRNGLEDCTIEIKVSRVSGRNEITHFRHDV